MKRRDWLIPGIVLLLSLLCFFARSLFFRTEPRATPVLRITVGGKLHSETPLDRAGEILLEQDGGQCNLVRFYPGGFEMAQSNCPNQDCVHQGSVTLENMEARPLYNQIICLPNRIVLELADCEDEHLLEVMP